MTTWIAIVIIICMSYLAAFFLSAPDPADFLLNKIVFVVVAGAAFVLGRSTAVSKSKDDS